MIHVTKNLGFRSTLSISHQVKTIMFLSVTEFKYVFLVATSIHGYKNEIVEKGNRYVLRV